MTKDEYERLAVELANISYRMSRCAPDFAAAQRGLILEARENIERMMEKIEVEA